MQGQALESNTRKREGEKKKKIHFDLGNSKTVYSLGAFGCAFLHAPFHQKTTR